MGEGSKPAVEALGAERTAIVVLAPVLVAAPEGCASLGAVRVDFALVGEESRDGVDCLPELFAGLVGGGGGGRVMTGVAYSFEAV